MSSEKRTGMMGTGVGWGDTWPLQALWIWFSPVRASPLLECICAELHRYLSMGCQPTQALWGAWLVAEVKAKSSCDSWVWVLYKKSRLALQGLPAWGLGGTAGVPWHCTRHPHAVGPTPCSLYPFRSHLGLGHPGRPEAFCLLEN